MMESKESFDPEQAFSSQIFVSLGIAAQFDAAGPSSQDLATLHKSETERLRNRVQLLQGLDALRGLYNVLGVLEPTVLPFALRSSGTGTLSKVETVPEDLVKACYETGHPIPDEFVLLLTSAPLAEGSLVIVDRSRVALVQEKAVRTLADGLGRDPWGGLIAVLIAKFMAMYDTDPSSSMTRLSVNEALDAIRKGSGHEIFRHMGFDRVSIDNALKAEVTRPDLRATSYADALAARDALGFQPLVESFARTVLHRDTTTPLVIAVIGEWGKGKSSFMRFLRQRLETHGTETESEPMSDLLVPRAITVWFDAWRYNSEERVLAALLETVAFEIQRRFKPWAWLRYRLRFAVEQLRSWRVVYGLLTHALIVPLVLIVAATLVFMIRSSGQWSVKEFVKTAVAGGGQAGFLVGLFYVAWRILQRLRLPLGLDLNKLYEEKDHSERLGYASVFKEEFERRLTQLARMPSALLRPLDASGNPGEAPRSGVSPAKDLASGNRVVIFVDDLDRCRPDTIVDILEAIKITFDTANIVFVLGMDEQYVRAGIYSKYRSHIQTQEALYSNRETSSRETDSAPLADLWPRRYLEKVIQIPFRLPDADPDQIKQMVSEVMAVAEGSFVTASRSSSLDESKHPVDEAGNQTRIQRALAEVDTPDVGQQILAAAMEVAPAHGANPRRVKSFVNRCRLGLYLLKLEMPEMLASDYAEALHFFTLWERQSAGLPDVAPGFPAGDWGTQLQRVQACIFRAAQGT
jgi:hypothetical protein